MTSNTKIIAIDGPSGVGKSSVSKKLAQSIGFNYINTGAIYRVIAYLSLKNNILPEKVANEMKLEFREHKVYANDVEVTNFIHIEEISLAASKVSAIPEVRAAVLDLQRNLGRSGNSILEGRDIGTVIFPDADIKFFMTASLDVRANRRFLESKEGLSLEEIKKQIEFRDKQDSERSVAPLKCADDAIVIDTSDLTFDEVMKVILDKLYENKIVCEK